MDANTSWLLDYITIYILKLHDPGYLDKYVLKFSKGHLPPEGAGDRASPSGAGVGPFYK